eukprot:193196_1
MLYKSIKFVSVSILCLIGTHTVNGAYITPTITANTDVLCGTGTTPADTCEINCNLDTPSIPNINCGNVGKCIIHCAMDSCLKNTNIYASDARNFEIDSEGKNCVQQSNMYLPNNGNASFIATAVGDNEVLDKFFIYAGTQTDHIYIECNDPDSNEKKECYAIQIDAKTAKHLEIKLNDAEFYGHETKTNEAAIIECPVNSPYSPSCIIDANTAASTAYLKIITTGTMPKDLLFMTNTNSNGDYTGTNVECSLGVSIINTNTNSFIGTQCYVTDSPTNIPTISPTNNIPSGSPSIQPSISPTKYPTDVPTNIPSNIPSNNPSISPSKLSTNIPSNNPSMSPIKIPSISPVINTISPTETSTLTSTNNPSVSPVKIPTISPVMNSISPSGSPNNLATSTTVINNPICDGNCQDIDDNIRIEVSYWFSDRIKYNLQNIECFLYKIFEQWFERYQFAETFTLCDINIIDINGNGNKYEDAISCSFPPCLHLETRRRILLQNNYDGNTTMTIITDDKDTYVLINGLAIHSMTTEFETAFANTFNVAINVEIVVKNENDDEQLDTEDTNNKLFLNPLYLIIISGCILFCCIITFLTVYCIRSRRGTRKPKTSVSDIVQATEGYDMTEIYSAGDENTTNYKNKKQLSSGKINNKLKHKRSATIDSWDLSNIQVQHKQTQEMWQNEIYSGGHEANVFDGTYQGRIISPLNENENGIEMVIRDPETLSNNNFNTYNNGMNEYQQNVQNNMNYQHEPHQTMGINSIQPNIVNKLTKKYNKKKRKQSERIDDESSEEEEEEEEYDSSTKTSSTNTLSGDDDDDDDDKRE